MSKKRGIETPAYAALLMYGICPSAYFTPFSYEAVRLYGACNGTARVETPEQYYALPAIYVDVCAVIESTLSAIRQQESEMKKRKEQEA